MTLAVKSAKVQNVNCSEENQYVINGNLQRAAGLVRGGREPMSEYLSEQRSGTRARRTVGNVGYARYSVRGVLALYEAANVSLR